MEEVVGGGSSAEAACSSAGKGSRAVEAGAASDAPAGMDFGLTGCAGVDAGHGVTLWLDCGAGVAGDMLVAALLDVAEDAAGAERAMREALESLPVEGFSVEVRRVHKVGFDCCDFNVALDAAHENHDHDMAYLHGMRASSAASSAAGDDGVLYEHTHEHEYAHEHACEYERARERTHEHTDEHDHEHRRLADIEALIAAASMTPAARMIALRTFHILASAEAAAHGTTIDQVHFHEVGAIDSIVDIISAAVLFDYLHIERVIVPRLVDGYGTVRCQHGIIPVPVPATLNICKEHGLPLGVCDVEGELVTPTGAALVAAVVTGFDLPERSAVRRVGIGAGKRSYTCPSILRAMLIEPLESAPVPSREARDCPALRGESSHVGEAPSGPRTDSRTPWVERAKTAPGNHTTEVDAPMRVVKLECDVDDVSPEVLAYAAELLRGVGAREVHWLPVFAKKGRPAYQLQVICEPHEVPALEGVIFREVGTLGIRRSIWERSVLPRELRQVETEFGAVAVKCSMLPDGSVRTKPEYEDCAAIACRMGVPLRDVIAAAEVAIRQLPG